VNQPPVASHPPSQAAPASAGPAQPPESDTPMTATYVRVLVFEAAILIALWFFGRMFS
jgi:hypothetical protein